MLSDGNPRIGENVARDVQAYHDKDFGEVVFDRILIVGDRVLLTGRRGADRFTSVFTVDERGVRRVQDYASVDAALDALNGRGCQRRRSRPPRHPRDPRSECSDDLRRVLIRDLGRHHRLANDVSGGATAGRADAGRKSRLTGGEIKDTWPVVE